MRSRTLIRVSAALFPAAAAALTLDVPGDFTQIQDAIDAASEGDSVLVHPGTYVETLDFGGRANGAIGHGGRRLDGRGRGGSRFRCDLRRR